LVINILIHIVRNSVRKVRRKKMF